jgi:hypothetical protein
MFLRENIVHYGHQNSQNQIRTKPPFFSYHSTDKMARHQIYWCVFFSCLRLFRLPLPILSRYKVIKFKAKRSSKNFQDTVKRDLQDLRNRLMNLLAEYEAMPENTTKEPSEAVKQLGITPGSIWQNIEIVLKENPSIRS